MGLSERTANRRLAALDGIQITTRGRAAKGAVAMHFANKMMDHLLGDIEVGNDAILQRPSTATMWAGVRPTISLASLPMALTALRRHDERSIATIEGSLITMPRFLTWTRVLAVPNQCGSRKSSPITDQKGCSRLFTLHFYR